MKANEVVNILGKNLKQAVLGVAQSHMAKLEEVRVRANKSLIVICAGHEFCLDYSPTEADINETLGIISNHSLYAFEEEIRNGYITIVGGHRVGICGKVILENGQVKTIKNISALNIRISHQILGCADKVLPYILKNQKAMHTLIVSPPRTGKTTLLRDLARQFSDKYGQTVGIVDERSEIAGCYRGVSQNDVGCRTDVLDSCPKSIGMRMLLRSMAPDVIVVDEIGKIEDIHAIEEILSCGIKLVCSVHASSFEDMKNKPVLNRLVEQKFFERVVVLSNKNGAGTIEKIINLEDDV